MAGRGGGGVQLNETQLAIKQVCRDFFRADEEGAKKYARLIDEMVAKRKTRLILDVQDLHAFPMTAEGNERARDLGHEVLLHPHEYVRFLDEAVREVVEHRDYLRLDIDPGKLRVGFEGYFGKFQVSPRQLGAFHLNKLIALEGVVTRTSANVAKVVKSVHWNEAKGSFTERQYRDQLSSDIDDKTLPTVNVMPKKDVEGNLLRTEYGLCVFSDMQSLVLQERPEKAPVGSLPQSTEVRLEEDLVDSLKPGDRARIIGVYMPYSEGKDLKTILLANSVSILGQKSDETSQILDKEIKAIKKLAKKEGVFDTLAAGVAPSIFGHNQIKKAIILMMLGGVEKDVGKHHIRGDIHLLMVGEPATAKSQLLRFVMKLAPFSLSTTGKGSTGVGLTGAVVTDPDTGDKSLAAGAMVLADRGVLCVDEFDKMGDGDRVAMHEAMEQGSVTIAKAGIQATLNGRCSVFAAANPVYGFYAVTHSVSFNIGLPESLLSRFDLLFIILDDKSTQWTRLVADHVLQNHRTGKGITIGHEAEDKDSLLSGGGGTNAASRKAVPTYLTHNPYSTHADKKLVSIDFLRLYIQYAKKMKPDLTDAAREKIQQHWINLREQQKEQEATQSNSAIYINPRTLESLIRLSTAHAKVRLSDTVDEKDVDVAIDMLKHTVNARQEAVESRSREAEAMDKQHGTAKDTEEVEEPAPSGKRGASEAATEPSSGVAAFGAPDPKRRKVDTPTGDAAAAYEQQRSTEAKLNVARKWLRRLVEHMADRETDMDQLQSDLDAKLRGTAAWASAGYTLEPSEFVSLMDEQVQTGSVLVAGDKVYKV
eukprot:TRINITY_DN21198_c0_g1_i1.p1 TRINITY_DN21198_c0_g1~~TRINITY_DN21198_c0_g1_i1.p1  ORF type:complete len:819 (+),score=327.68 TRINITY_DN21198_c0_g1_i1:54-2510(+)